MIQANIILAVINICQSRKSCQPGQLFTSKLIRLSIFAYKFVNKIKEACTDQNINDQSMFSRSHGGPQIASRFCVDFSKLYEN